MGWASWFQRPGLPERPRRSRRYVRWRSSIKRLINPTAMVSTPMAVKSPDVAGPVPAIIQIAPAPMMPRETKYAGTARSCGGWDIQHRKAHLNNPHFVIELLDQ